jgi:pyruvate dehydrogenase E1 component alpha subunit
MHRVIGERSLDETGIGPGEARALFEDMIRARAFDERALSLQRQGWMSGYPPFRGQEGSQVGAAHAMRAVDWLFPTYRANAMAIARGVPLRDILLFRRGYPEFVSDHEVRNFPQAVPIATQLPHAVGFGMAIDYRNGGERDVSGPGVTPTDGGPADETDADADDREAVVAYLGDGATSEGDTHEAMNFAGVFEVPVLFLCENNGWAISTPRERQTAADSIAARAEAYGFEGVQVDGTDALAVREFLGRALRRVRAGEPLLVESLVYRHGPHTTSDDPSRYEDRADVPDWRRRDPLDRLEEYLVAEGVVGEPFREAARETADAEIDEAVAAAEAVAPPGPAAVFEHAYATIDADLAAQRDWLLAYAEQGFEPGGPAWE